MPEWQLTTAATVERARAVFEVHRDRLREHGVPGELELTGGSSVAGLLTKGDIDLLRRVYAEAKRRDRPVLISIGYAACHWCHVMAHESFENPDIA